MQKVDFLKYEWCDGSHHKVDANVAAEVTKSLEEQGMLTAHNLVDVSRPEDAPLHPEFEWNDVVAAEKYRENQARNVIHSLRVVVDSQKEPERVFCNLVVTKPEYTAISRVVQNVDMREMALRNARREMEAFIAKYGFFEEKLGKVLGPMRELLKEMLDKDPSEPEAVLESEKEIM